MNEDYWNGVIANMSDGDHVRFGTTGGGIYPNYQIVSQSGDIRPRPFLGRNHERDTKTQQYDDANLTDVEYVLADLMSPEIRRQIHELIQKK